MLGAQDSGKNPWVIGFGLSMPIWADKNRSRVKEAELNKEKASQGKKAMEAQLIANIKKIYFRLENSSRLIELYENSLIPQAQNAIEIAETWHQEEGSKSIAGILEAQSIWLNFNLAKARAITDYQQNLVRLEQLVGGSIDKEQADDNR